jgi:hypothetical protein
MTELDVSLLLTTLVGKLRPRITLKQNYVSIVHGDINEPGRYGIMFWR